ncbi:MAG: ribosome-associated translation inhibitor RaiA [Verrucomicrobia bacterium]|nr:ribosome-associated translation inhibitor RaiA [Verrucomicrobiota bacterium]
MQISVTARHMEITDAIRDYAERRVEEAIMDFPRVENVHVILDVEKYRHKAEIVVQAANHIRVEAEAESDDMYVSIDNAAEKAQKQLRKLRDKVQDHKSRESLAAIELDVQSSSEVSE